MKCDLKEFTAVHCLNCFQKVTVINVNFSCPMFGKKAYLVEVGCFNTFLNLKFYTKMLMYCGSEQLNFKYYENLNFGMQKVHYSGLKYLNLFTQVIFEKLAISLLNTFN